MFDGGEDLSNYLKDYFISYGMSAQTAHLLNLAFNILVLIILLLVVYYITRKVVIWLFKTFTNKTETTFDDFLLQSKFPKYIGNILPLLLLIIAVPVVFEDYEQLLDVFETLTDLYIIFLSVLICRSFLRSTQNYLKTTPRFKDKPLESYIQVLMIFIWAIGFVFVFSELTGESVLNFFISLGAASAIILLIFKDTILGFVASIQVSVNDIVRIGDWITFSKFGADGFVTEINLATVKVQNWDKTYTTIPTYSLIADSFQNWRGMEESPGRRIMRSLYIKQNSVRFITESDLGKFKKFNLIAPYLEERQKVIDEHNKKFNFDRKIVINGRNQTNLGVFRKYANTYLNEHPAISKELFIMARLLSPTTKGIPLQIYCFSIDKRWAYHEEVNADIFEHLIAAVPYFDLQLFEEPSGDDIQKSLQRLEENH